MLRTRGSAPALLPIAEDLASGVVAGNPGDPTARMGTRSGQVEPVNRQPVAGTAEEWPPQEEAVQARLGVVRVAAGQAVVLLQVERAEYLPAHDELGDPGSVWLEGLEGEVAELVATGRPGALAQGVRRVLQMNAHHVVGGAARSGARIIDQCRIKQ